MPMPLIPTPWIRAAQPAEHFTRGAGIGAEIGQANARIAMESARLKAQQDQNALETEIKQHQIEQNARLEAQRNAITEAYHQAQIGLQQQKLSDTAVQNQMKLREFANRSAAIMEYDTGMRQIESRTDLDETQKQQARAELAMRVGPQISRSFGGIAPMFRQPATVPERFISDPQTGARYIIGPKGTPVQQRPVTAPGMSVSPLDRSLMDSLESSIAKDQSDLTVATDEKIKSELKNRIEQSKQRIDTIRTKYGLEKAYDVPTSGATKIVRDPKTGKLVVQTSEGTLSPAGPARAEPDIPTVAPIIPGAPAWEATLPEGMPVSEPLSTGAPLSTTPAPGAPMFTDTTAAGRSPIIPRAQDLTLRAAGRTLRSPLGKALADLGEGISGLVDLPFEELTNLRKRYKKLRDDILEATARY